LASRAGIFQASQAACHYPARAKAQRQDARNAILEESRHKIERAKAAADAELAANQAKQTEAREATRLEANAKLVEEQRKLAELQDYNKPENEQRRQEIARLEARRVEEASKAEVARVEAEAKSAQRIAAAKAKVEAARVKAAEEAERRQALGLGQGRSAFPPEPAPRPASAPNLLQMNCHPEHSTPYFVTYNGNVGTVLVTGSETGRTRTYPVRGIHDDSGRGMFYVNAKRNDQNRTLFFAFNYSNDGGDGGIRVKGVNSDTRDACTPVQH
jgi:hypothetical protein